MQVEREALLKQLEIVAPGLSSKDIVEQSSCVVFQNGYLMSYNDEVACRLPTEVELDGAIHAQTLIDCLRKMKEEVISIEQDDNQIILVGRNKKIGVRRQAEIFLPIDSVEAPDKWVKLPEDFSDALEMIIACAGKDEQKFSTTCVMFHPNRIEATDDFQVGRYAIDLPLKDYFLIRAVTAKHIIPFGVTRISVTSNWVHFRSPMKLILSCRRHLETFPVSDSYFELEGQQIRLPKALGEAADLAEVFSSQNADKNEVIISIKPGKLTVIGEGVSGWSRETKKIKYDGPPMKFRAIPKMLKAIAEKHNECEICGTSVLRVRGGSYSYISALGVVDDEGDDE